MTKPPFRLQTLLSIKTSVVEALEQELAELLAAQQQQEAALAALKQTREARHSRLRRQGSLDCGNLSYEWTMLEGLDSRIHQQEKIVQMAQERTDEKRAELVGFMQEKKVLEKLKEKAEREWNQEVARVEAKVIDELSTAKFGRQRAGYDTTGGMGK